MTLVAFICFSVALCIVGLSYYHHEDGDRDVYT